MSYHNSKRTHFTAIKIPVIFTIFLNKIFLYMYRYLYDNLIKEVDRSAFIGLQSLEYLYVCIEVVTLCITSSCITGI